MEVELREFPPLRTANVAGVLYAIFMLLFSLPFVIMMFFVPDPVPTEANPNPVPMSTFWWFALVYPAFGLVFGWLGGLTGAWVYNLVAPRLGGFRFTLRVEQGSPQTPAA